MTKFRCSLRKRREVTVKKAAVPKTVGGGAVMNLNKLESIAVVESVTFEGASVSVNPGTKVTSVVPQWGRMEVASMGVIEGHLCVSLEDFPFDPLEGTGNLNELMSLVSGDTSVRVSGAGFAVEGTAGKVKPLVQELMSKAVDTCFGYRDSEDGDGFIEIYLKSSKQEE